MPIPVSRTPTMRSEPWSIPAEIFVSPQLFFVMASSTAIPTIDCIMLSVICIARLRCWIWRNFPIKRL